MGNLHVHSVYSDGSGTIAEIAKSGKEADLDFIIITDHYTLEGLKEEGYYQDVLVLVGMEINKDCHHYLAMDVNQVIENNDANPQEVIDRVKEQGGIGFITHPFESGSPLFFKGKVYPWLDWSVYDYDGICVWNYCSQWRDGATNLLTALYTTFINPNYKIVGPCPKALAKLDNIGQLRRIVAIGGSDAHAVKVKYGPLKFTVFPYEFLFLTVNTHVITSEALNGVMTRDKRLILEALKEGSCFIAQDYYSSSKGFRCWVECSQNKEIKISMGKEVAYREGLKIVANLPSQGLIKVIRDGVCVYQVLDHKLDYSIEHPGVIRLEIYLQKKGIAKNKLLPWIFTNPFFLR